MARKELRKNIIDKIIKLLEKMKVKDKNFERQRKGKSPAIHDKILEAI